jgi:hypothetical protein
MKKTLFLCCLIATTMANAQTKHALIVAIGDYPVVEGRTKNWSDLSSMNDVEMVTAFLKEQGFPVQNTTSLLNEKATATNLMKEFDRLITSIKEGDMVYFHFSGHGQQVADLSQSDAGNTKFLKQDENDGLDESLVLYDAPMEWELGYKLEKHFVDDQIGYYMQKIRAKIGKKGQLLVLLDACHSGTATRGAESLTVRGTTQLCVPSDYSPKKTEDNTLGFDADLDLTQSNNLANLVAFFGCKAEQVNREIKDENGKGYGSLTYFFIKAVNELKDNASYQNLYSRVNEKMIIQFRNEQHPVVEADEMNTLVFNGGLVVQKPFFNVSKIAGDMCVLDGGYLRGLQKGDTVGLYPNTTIDPKEVKCILKGAVNEVNAYSTVVSLDKYYDGPSTDAIKYRTFVMNAVNTSASVKLKLNVRSKSAKKQLSDYFKQNSAVVLTEEGFDYQIVDTIIKDVPHAKIYIGNNTTNALRGMDWKPLNINSILDSFSLYLTQSRRTDVFRKLDFESKTAKLEMTIFSCLSNCDSEKPEWHAIPVSGNFQVKEGNSFKVELKNTGSKVVYVNIVDIYPTNEVHWLENVQDPSVSFRNLKVDPGKQNPDLKIIVGPPYGMEQFKILVTDRPLDLSQLEENGSSLATRGGSDHPLMDFVDQELKGTRGGSVSSELGASAYNVFFEIIEK